MKIALVENFGSDFYNARLRYAQFLISKGCEVTAIVPDDGFVEKIKSEGIKVIAVNNNLRERSIVNIFNYIKSLYSIFKNNNFDIIHLYRFQPNVFGTFAAKVSGNKLMFNHITGLGMAFSNNNIKYKLISKLITLLYRLNHSLFNANLIYQNEFDKNQIGVNTNKVIVIKGSAVNESKFTNRNVLKEKNDFYSQLDLSNNTLKVLFVSRLLKQKGLVELIEAIKIVNNVKYEIELLIVGWIDKNNPDSFKNEEIEELSQINWLKFLGKRHDINNLIEYCDISVLPTYYREGTPRFLLESMCMSKPIITTNMPGCDHLIETDSNGYLVEPKSVQSLLNALNNILLDKKNGKLDEMGLYSRNKYIREFSENVVYNSIYNFYKTKIR